MNKLRFFTLLTLIFALTLSFAAAAPPATCGNVSSVNLFAPNDFTITGSGADAINFQGLWIEQDTPPLVTDCRLEIYTTNGTVNFTGDPVSSTRSSLTTFPVDKDSFLLFYEEGLYEWNIGCYTNISNSCELLYAPNNRTVTFDFSGPIVTLDEVADQSVFAPGETININFTVNDVYDGGTFNCLLYDAVEEFVTTVDNEENGLFSFSKDDAGVYPWYVSCQDTFGNEQNSSTRYYIVDDDAPAIVLDSPIGPLTLDANNTIEINFSVTDGYDPSSLTCDIYVDGLSVDSQIVANGTSGQYNHSFSADGDYDVSVGCVDQVGNAGFTANQSVTVAIGALLPVIYDMPSVTNVATLELIGYTSKPGTVNVTLVSEDFPFQKSNSTPTLSGSFTNDLGNTTVTQIYNDSFFRIETNLGGNITAGTYLAFAGHNLLNFMYYNVLDVIPVLDYFRINITPTMNQSVSVAEDVYFYDASLPTGWFNISINLYPGANNVSVYGSQLGIPGTAYETNVIYDAAGPTFDLTNLSGLQSSSTINFMVLDEYNVSLETLYVNMTLISNASTYSVYTLANSLYNLSSVAGTISCINTTLDMRSCSFTHALADGSYNLSFSVEDSYGQVGVDAIASHIVKSTVQPVPSIQDQGTTTSNLSIYVNWSSSPDAYLDYYEISLGTALGVSDVIAWSAIASSQSNYTFTHANLTYNDWYFINIRAVDTLGGTSATASTNGITIEDNTPPLNDNIEIIADVGSVWVNDGTQLTLLWNFTDDESTIVSYEYAIGTNTYPLAGWDSLVSTSSTISNSFTEVGLTLVEGETYYVSAKARNSNLFGGNRWSNWYSSAGVTVDTQDPENGYLTYSSGSIDVNYIDVTFVVGNDSISGVSRATILSRKAALSSGSCSFSGAPDYQEELNATIIAALTPQNYTFTNLENGYCYRFALDVYDNAGNSVRYGTNQISTVGVDYTPPSTVAITDDGFVTATTSLYFEWTPAIDNESAIAYYEYALGTSAGASNIINWTNHGLSRTVSFTSEDYLVGHLLDEETYYLSVRAWNDHNESSYSQASSDGIFYFDFEIPNALALISVGNDTTDDGWFDATSDTNVSVILNGESGLSCVWSFYDIDYVDPSSPFADSCSEIPGNNSYYNCTLTNITQGSYDISVACVDAAGNKQTTASNTDFTLYKDNVLPTISIIAPNETVVPADEVDFIALINETSPYTLEHYIYATADDSLLDYTNYGTLTTQLADYNYDFTGESGEYIFYYVLTDAYNNSINDSVTIIINNNQPLATINVSNGYLTESQDLGISAYFFNNISYQLSNGSGVQLTFSDTNVILQNKTIYNLSIDTTTLSDGNYSLVIDVFAPGLSSSLSRSYTIDTIHPKYALGSFEQEPSNPIYEDDNITLYHVWDAAVGEASIYLTHNATGTYENVSVENVSMGFVVYPGSTRYKAIIDSSKLTTATTFTYQWVAYDAAQNYNYSTPQTINIVNRAPVITGETSYSGLSGENFVALINFSDVDASQNNASYFDCSDNSAQFDSVALSNSLCMVNWSNPSAGNYSFTLTLFDQQDGANLSSDSETITVEILPSIGQNISVTANVEFNVVYFLGAQIITTATSYTSEDIMAVIANAAGYTINISTNEEVSVLASGVDVSNPGSVLLRKLNTPFINNQTNNVGAAYRYVPYSAYAIEINFSTTDNYTVSFPYGNYSIPQTSKLQILKFDYDVNTNTIDYDTLNVLDTTVNSATLIASAPTSNFSAFVLSENQDFDSDGYFYNVDCRDDMSAVNPGATEICDSIDNNCDGNIDEGCSTGGGSSGGGGGGSYVIPDITCEDGIQNGAEVGVDCGGTCGACEEEVSSSTEPSYCYNGFQDYDEFGVDCGGSCIAICEYYQEDFVEDIFIQPTCVDGLKNQNEVGVDCGGVCPRTCESTIKPIEEKPEPVKEKKGIFGTILFIILGLLVAGGLLIVVARSRGIDVLGLDAHPIVGKITFNGSSTIADDDVASIARYIEQHQDENYSTKSIKNHLVKHGYSEVNVNAAIDALAQDDYTETVQEYLKTYADQGFNDEELQDWLLEKGIKAHVVAVAMDRHRRSRNRRE